jgi:hydrogenase maturation protein HypF
VQGVGFRPFIYRLAQEEHLTGFIGNDTDGVFIEIEGLPASADAFIERVRAEAPPLSRIDSVSVEDAEPQGDTSFCIIASEVLGRVSTGIPADAATCPDCLRELLTPADRRYRYPFLNCTNCGPRFTITRRIPYDRPQTSMARFTMCPACQAEYDDPANRRFHAQPNACWNCGPQLSLTDNSGELIPSADVVKDVIARLAAGEILAIKGIGGFHLSVDATNDAAVMRLRQRKHRYGKPLAVMVRDLDAARSICEVSDAEASLLTAPMRPIVLLRRRPDSAIEIAGSVAPGIPWLGIFLPYAPLHHLLFAGGNNGISALVMTSANLSEEPIAIDNDEACARLANIADAFVLHNREILQRCDDSVASLVDGAPQIIRRARGYVPLGIELPFDTPPLLAVGGHLKNVFALARGRHIYQSQHLGDLESITCLDFFRESLDHLMRTFEIEPAIVVHDLHPGYLSTQWATEWAAERGLRTIAVQHHFAHVAGCMAEHGVDSDFIGLSLDGTGYGTDGRIWGGEVLVGHLSGGHAGTFERFAHLAYVPMPGGEAAIREPWRMALGHFNGSSIDSSEFSELLGAKAAEVRVLSRMIERGINSPLTSSCGRLFDAVAALVLRRTHVDYEAQAAIELEGVAIDEPYEIGTTYELELNPGDWSKGVQTTISATRLWSAIVQDLRAGTPRARVAAQFHAAVADAFIRAAVLARSATGIQHVALSGGCMHNRRLVRLLRTGLESQDFGVLQHAQVSPGDGGLSYGQAAVAAAILLHSQDRASS